MIIAFLVMFVLIAGWILFAKSNIDSIDRIIEEYNNEHGTEFVLEYPTCEIILKQKNSSLFERLGRNPNKLQLFEICDALCVQDTKYLIKAELNYYDDDLDVVFYYNERKQEIVVGYRSSRLIGNGGIAYETIPVPVFRSGRILVDFVKPLRNTRIIQCLDLDIINNRKNYKTKVTELFFTFKNAKRIR